jgi:serine O-acetyltransferase
MPSDSQPRFEPAAEARGDSPVENQSEPDEASGKGLDYGEIVKSLTECSDDALSQAACGGIIDPAEVIEWVQMAKRLLLYQRESDAIRTAVPDLDRRLRRLLVQVELPSGSTPESVAVRFMKRLADVRALLSQDVEAAYQGDPASQSYAEIAVSYPSIRALAIYRVAHELHEIGVPLLPRIMTEYAHDRTGMDIHPGARIGERFFVDHGTGVVIGETAEIGTRVRLYQGVTLGALSLRDGAALRGRKRHPTVEDDVTIYAGATILGGKTVIGQGSVIGGNVWLTRSVPPHSRVVAEPPQQQVSEDGKGLPSQLTWDI